MGTDKAEDAKTDSSLTEGSYLLVLRLNAGLPLCEYADFNLCLPISYAGATTTTKFFSFWMRSFTEG